jgi:hypothetical protein
VGGAPGAGGGGVEERGAEPGGGGAGHTLRPFSRQPGALGGRRRLLQHAFPGCVSAGLCPHHPLPRRPLTSPPSPLPSRATSCRHRHRRRHLPRLHPLGPLHPLPAHTPGARAAAEGLAAAAAAAAPTPAHTSTRQAEVAWRCQRSLTSCCTACAGAGCCRAHLAAVPLRRADQDDRGAG